MTKSVEKKDHIAAWLQSNEIGIVVTGDLFATARKPEATQDETNAVYNTLMTVLQQTKPKPSNVVH